MSDLTVFHSGSPNWASCKKAIVVAEAMKNIFGEKINLQIYTLDSLEAMKYKFKSATNVLLDGNLIPLDISLDKQKLKDFLSEKIAWPGKNGGGISLSLKKLKSKNFREYAEKLISENSKVFFSMFYR